MLTKEEVKQINYVPLAAPSFYSLLFTPPGRRLTPALRSLRHSVVTYSGTLVAVTDDMLRLLSEEIAHLLGPAELIEGPVKYDMLVEVKEAGGVAADAPCIVGNEDDRGAMFTV